MPHCCLPPYSKCGICCTWPLLFRRGTGAKRPCCFIYSPLQTCSSGRFCEISRAISQQDASQSRPPRRTLYGPSQTAVAGSKLAFHRRGPPTQPSQTSSWVGGRHGPNPGPRPCLRLLQGPRAAPPVGPTAPKASAILYNHRSLRIIDQTVKKCWRSTTRTKLEI